MWTSPPVLFLSLSSTPANNFLFTMALVLLVGSVEIPVAPRSRSHDPTGVFSPLAGGKVVLLFDIASEPMGVGMRNGLGGVMSLFVRAVVGVGSKSSDLWNQSSSFSLPSGVLKISCNNPLF